MRLNYEQIKAVITGAEIIEECIGGYKFSRFTKEQKGLYENFSEEQAAIFEGRSEACLLRAKSTSGIKLSFRTDSESLFLRVFVTPGSSRQYFSIDVFANGECVGVINNYNKAEMTGDYTATELPLGSFEKNFELWKGMKEITVYLPWSVGTMIEDISIDDGAVLYPMKRKKTLLSFGDSITQGYDALRSSGTYVARLARALNADEVNKGIGGEMFLPELAASAENFVPDYVTVAYGINDWSHKSRIQYEKDCRRFFDNLSKAYPNSKKFAITPIWTAIMNEEKSFGRFEDVDETIRGCIVDESITVISGMELVPHDEKLFGDLSVHPNDKGFGYYFENLLNEIKKYI